MRTWILTICLIATSSLAVAQEVTVQVAQQEPPYYVGEPMILQFTVAGFAERPEPQCTMLQEVEHIRGQMAGASPSVFSQIVQRNGQIVQSKRITYRVNFQVTAERAGEYEVGPFLLKQGNKEARVDAVTLKFNEVPEDPDMQVRLLLPEGPIYPDQRVQVGIQWSYAGDFNNILKMQIYSPLFDQFRFAPDQRVKDDSEARLPIETREGRLVLTAKVSQRTVQQKRFTVVTATRTLIPDRTGDFTLAPITATVRRATAWSRRGGSPADDFFRNSLLDDFFERRRQPTQVELARASGQPLKLSVKPFPTAGRPDSFAGAVGEGFSLEVNADRTVVRVGDPITLDLTLRGKGNLENVSLPDLSADNGMNPDQFRLPEGEVAGTTTATEKKFQVAVRVTDEAVDEIPALAYSWFDPANATYQTTRSKPIALRVMPAQIVSAGDVVTASPRQAEPADTNPEESRSVANAPSMTVREFSLTGADLAIEPDVGAVLRQTNSWGNLIVQLSLYLGGLGLLALAILDRRRRRQDPLVTQQRKLVEQQVTTIRDAGDLPAQPAAREIAEAIRLLLAHCPQASRTTAQTLIAECEAVAYKPQMQGTAKLDRSLIDRAQTFANDLHSAKHP